MPSVREPVATAPTPSADGEIPRRELLGYALGGRTSGFDLVGRHAYEVGARIFTSDSKGEGDVSYAYQGLGNPTIGVTASQTWDDDGVRVRRPLAGEEGSETFFVLERERRLATWITVSRPRMRTYVALTVSGGLVQSDRELLGRPPADRPLCAHASEQHLKRVRGGADGVHDQVARIPDGECARRVDVRACPNPR